MLEAWQHKEGQRHDEKVDRFLDAHPNINFKSINVGGSTVILFEEQGLDLTDFALIENILEKQKAVENEGIVNNCYFIAVDAVDDGFADGVMSAEAGASKVINFDNHAVNVKQLDDGSFLVMDFTAPENQDRRRGIFKTFCIHTTHKEDVLTILSEFHGGEWRELSEETLAEIRNFNRRKVA